MRRKPTYELTLYRLYASGWQADRVMTEIEPHIFFEARAAMAAATEETRKRWWHQKTSKKRIFSRLSSK